jgi:ATP-binding protein involved in chromosome partitioning
MPETPDLASAVRAALDAIPDPLSGKGLLAAGRITGVVASANGRVGFALETDTPQKDEALRLLAEKAARDVAGVSHVTAVLTAHETSPARRRRPRPRPRQQNRPAS